MIPINVNNTSTNYIIIPPNPNPNQHNISHQNYVSVINGTVASLPIYQLIEPQQHKFTNINPMYNNINTSNILNLNSINNHNINNHNINNHNNNNRQSISTNNNMISFPITSRLPTTGAIEIMPSNCSNNINQTTGIGNYTISSIPTNPFITDNNNLAKILPLHPQSFHPPPAPSIINNNYNYNKYDHNDKISKSISSAVESMPIIKLNQFHINQSPNPTLTTVSSSNNSENIGSNTRQKIDNNEENKKLILHETTRNVNIRQSSLYCCTVCQPPRYFKHKCNLNAHKKIHGGTAIQCTYCHKKFARNSNLKQHLRFVLYCFIMHTG